MASPRNVRPRDPLDWEPATKKVEAMALSRSELRELTQMEQDKRAAEDLETPVMAAMMWLVFFVLLPTFTYALPNVHIVGGPPSGLSTHDLAIFMLTLGAAIACLVAGVSVMLSISRWVARQIVKFRRH